MSKDFYLKEINSCTCLESIRVIADFARVDTSLTGADYQEVVSKIYQDANAVQFKRMEEL